MLVRSVVRAYRWLARRVRPARAAHRARRATVHDDTVPQLVAVPAQRKPHRCRRGAHR